MSPTWETRRRLYGPSGIRDLDAFKKHARDSHIGLDNHQSGRSHSIESREKISKAKSGVKLRLSPEQRAKRKGFNTDTWRLAKEAHDRVLLNAIEQLTQSGCTIVFRDRAMFHEKRPDIIYYKDGLIVAIDVKTKGATEIDGMWRVSAPS